MKTVGQKIWVDEEAPNIKRKPVDFAMALMMLSMGVITIAVTFYLVVTEFDYVVIIVGILGILIIFIGRHEVNKVLDQKHLFVSENGIGLPVSYRFEREDVKLEFMEFSQIESLDFFDSEGYRLLFLKIRGGKDFNIEGEFLSAPLRFLRAVESAAPEKLSPDVRKILDNRMEVEQESIDPIKRSARDSFSVNFTLGGQIVLVLASSYYLTLVESGQSRVSVYYFLPILISMCIIFLPFVYDGERRLELDTQKHFSRAVKGEVLITRTFLARVLKKLRYSVPWEEIRTIKRRINNFEYANSAEIELDDGSKVEVPYSVLEVIEKHGVFRKIEDGLENPNPLQSMGPVSRIQLWRLGLVSFLGCLGIFLFTGGLYRIYTFGIDQPEMLLLSFLTFALLMVIVYYFLNSSKEMRLHSGAVTIDTQGIRIVDNEKHTQRFISKHDIKGIGKKPDMAGKCCEVRTASGSEYLSLKFY